MPMRRNARVCLESACGHCLQHVVEREWQTKYCFLDRADEIVVFVEVDWTSERPTVEFAEHYEGLGVPEGCPHQKQQAQEGATA